MQYRIKEILSEKGMMSKELGERLGKSAPYISAVIAGRQSVSIGMLEDIAKALDVPMWQIFVSPDEAKKDMGISSPNAVDVIASDFMALIKFRGQLYEADSILNLEALIAQWKGDEIAQSHPNK